MSDGISTDLQRERLLLRGKQQTLSLLLTRIQGELGVAPPASGHHRVFEDYHELLSQSDCWPALHWLVVRQAVGDKARQPGVSVKRTGMTGEKCNTTSRHKLLRHGLTQQLQPLHLAGPHSSPPRQLHHCPAHRVDSPLQLRLLGVELHHTYLDWIKLECSTHELDNQ